ncbi:capsular exopolysaccharide family [Burkholderia sp. lig30]|jgi:tyrosine-protein kinase Etk/Wzc|uniref:polysaccharide biosynthesis tyrosine autokinase n=1 Tax=Burkholderia sp. lig30 TaxID=1192124 RepID=UPI000461FA89|nr:polysaccharide biosynthesis tyrosine autokinase [Burkholderia sp. lig30]KDB09695.1 capsular exopolysaccharide family [Burkholderia sp. lig30]
MSEISSPLEKRRTAQSLYAGDDEGGISIGEFVDLLRNGMVTILITAVIVALLGQVVSVMSPRVFVASGLVQVEASAGGPNSTLTELTQLLTGAPAQTAAELQVLQSRVVLDQVVDKLNLQISTAPKAFPVIGNTVQRLRQNLPKPSSAPFGLGKFAWGGEKFVVTRFDVPDDWIGHSFTLTAGEAGHYVLTDSLGVVVLRGITGKLATSADGKVELLVSGFVARPHTEFTVRKVTRQEALGKISPYLMVAEQGSSSGVLQITYKGSSPEFVTDVVAAIQQAYFAQNIARRSQDAQQSLDFLKRQLPLLKDQLAKSQEKLAAYQKSNSLVDITGETRTVLQETVQLQADRLKLQQDRMQVIQRFTPQHPAVKMVDDQIGVLDAKIAELSKRTQGLPDVQQKVFSLTRDLEANTQLYTAMLSTIQGLEISRAGTIGNVRILELPLQPLAPASPRTDLITGVSIFLGLALGVGLVLAQRMLMRGVDDPFVLERRFGVSTYASIPYVSEQREITRRLRQGEGYGVLAAFDPKNRAVEALRALRTSLQFKMLDAPNNVIMVTGPIPNIGKSFVATNLGAVLALSGKRVVVVDADLRRGRLHEYFQVPVHPGLSELIADAADAGAAVRSSEIDLLDVVPRGDLPSNPAELVMHRRLDMVIKALSEQYDYVLIDSAPIFPVSDSAVIARTAGTILLVLKSGEHREREIQEALARLDSSGVKCDGFIFNQVGARAGSYGYGYGYAYSYGYEYTSEVSEGFVPKLKSVVRSILGRDDVKGNKRRDR